MENLIIGYILATFVGFSLGLLGGGGSILTVPILVYVIHLPPKTSIALSLAIVGISGIAGVLGYIKNRNILFNVAGIFGLFAAIGTVAGTKIAAFIPGKIQLLLFAITMLIASVMMIRGRKEMADTGNYTLDLSPKKLLFIGLQAIFVGVLTGIVGVGGGFMIVPALVLLMNVPMKRAVGTSLLIITANSLIGFYSYLQTIQIPWEFLLKFSGFSIIGIILGTAISNKVPQKGLKKGFGYFLIVMGIFVLIKNL